MVVVISAVSAALLLVAVVLILVAWRGSRGVFDEYLEPLDEKQFQIKKYLGIGLWFMQHFPVMRWVPAGFNHTVQRYENNIRSKVAELYSIRYQDYFMQIHIATRWLMGLLGFFFLNLFALVMASGGDWQTGADMT